MDAGDKITLVSSDNEKFELSTKASKRSVLINKMIEDYQDKTEFPVNNVNKKNLQKIVQYLEHYENTNPTNPQAPLPPKGFQNCVESWDFEFLPTELEDVFELIQGANFMDIQPLMELTAAKIADVIRNKTADDIRTTFNIKNDFTKEEEEQMIKGDKWKVDEIGEN